ncbi:transposase [Streptomyces sp. NPDC002888]|uniref:transposase n=1 Tax=Streptomyces sp. NPDC002888 TaxID=3364668 RepID=UPI0036C8EE56
MSLTDEQWARIEPLLPDRTPKRGGRWRDHRQVIDAIAFKYRTGTPWMDRPEHFGSWKGVHNRLRTWALTCSFCPSTALWLVHAWSTSTDQRRDRADQGETGTMRNGRLSMRGTPSGLYVYDLRRNWDPTAR